MSSLEKVNVSLSAYIWTEKAPICKLSNVQQSMTYLPASS